MNAQASSCFRNIAAAVSEHALDVLPARPVGGHRVPLFVCAECGDFACGTITARVSRTKLGVQWSDFTYENGFDAASEFDIGPFEFEWASYLSEIERSKSD